MTSSENLAEQEEEGGEKKCRNSELWHACAGPLVCLPNVGSPIVYFPQGHSEQVAASTNKEVEGQIPNYPNLSPQLICQLHNVTMHADIETDEVYAQMTLQPLTLQEQKETCVPMEIGIASKQPTNYFCKTLTASDASTHGGFSVPRREAEKVFPPLDFSQQPPSQELIGHDIHDVEWKFRHIFRGQPKRHLLTTGWSVFVSAKRLVSGDSVIFIWKEKNRLYIGIRRASRPQTIMPSSVLSCDSMHIGILAAAAHAASTNGRFTVFYNPRASPSEFVIPLSRYVKAACQTQLSVGLRFRMLFETEDSSVRRYMGTITGIDDLDHEHWPNSLWRSVKVGWDESTAGDKQSRVSLWEIEPLTTFPTYPSLFPLSHKRPWRPRVTFAHEIMGGGNNLMLLRGDMQGHNPLNYQSHGMGICIPQMLEPLPHGDEHNPYYNIRGNFLKQQLQECQQPFQFPQLSCSTKPFLPQQLVHEIDNQQLICWPSQNIDDNHDNMNKKLFFSGNNRMHHQTSQVPSQLSHNSGFTDSGAKFSTVSTPSCATNDLSLSRVGQPLSEPKQTVSQVSPVGVTILSQPFFKKNASVENHNAFDVNSEFTFGTHISTVPFTSSIQNYLYGHLDESPRLLLNGDATDLTSLPSKTFVKVYKSGSVGRILDIASFSSYEELREELGQMFGIEGELKNPLRSGWQLLFVDRENDMLLLGDDPWEAFVKNVWYIKILSPQDVLKMAKSGVESFG